MTSKEAIRTALNFGHHLTTSLADAKANCMTRPGEFGGNHLMWITGHLAVAEGRLQKILHGTPNPVEHWKPLFDWGSPVSDDASTYPPFEDVLSTYQALRAKTIAFLDSLDDAALNRPTAIQPPDIDGFETIGGALLVIAMHQCMHGGQGTVARRASGNTPFFTPSAAARAF